MNTADLNRALHAIADEVDDDPGTRLASVTRRLETARTSKRAGILVTTCAVLATLVLLPNWGLLPRSDSHSSAGRPPYGSLATVDDSGLLIYRDAAGVRLLGSQVGAPGSRAVTVSVTPRTGDLGWTQPCRAGEGRLRYHLSVNGTDVPSAVLESLRMTGATTLSRPNGRCDAVGSPIQSERSLSVSPSGNIAGWRRLAIVPGRTARFTLSVTATDDPAGRAALARARPALAIFERPGDRAPDHGLWIDRHIVDPPAAKGAFTLVRREFVTLGAGTTRLTVPVPDHGAQVYVRTFVKNGERSGVTLSAGQVTDHDLRASVAPWSIEKLFDSGSSSVPAAVATVPDGARTNAVAAILVYVRQS